jgi:alpha,alpha-trehalose phosphorylase
VTVEEASRWEVDAADIAVPYDEERGIHPQDAAFLQMEPWDLEATPPEQFPLLLHYHPLVIYRHQVIKQADIVLAMFMVGDAFTPEDKRRNFDYYDKLTTGDSSLSACMQAIVAAEIGYEEHALGYFRYALLMDLADVAGNVSDGVHIASAAGVWQSLVFGFGGVRDFNGGLSIDPRLPKKWNSLEFSLRFWDRQLRVELTHDTQKFTIDEGEPVEIEIRGKQRRLEPGVALELKP